MEAKELKNKSRHIQADTEKMLWAVSAGICEFRGCCNKLYTHHVTKENVNLAEKAHIYAFSEGGKRFSRLLPRTKINDIDNLMLVCENCHKLIDSPNTNYRADELIAMKKEHEERVAKLVSIKPDLQSEIVIYCANIASSLIKIDDYIAIESITPEFYPARPVPLKFSPDLHLYDSEPNYWSVMAQDLERVFAINEPALRNKHISLFAVAPQPVLFKLGTLLNRNYNVDVRQPQGSIAKWRWRQTEKTFSLEHITLPELVPQNHVAFTIELTAQLSEDELRGVFGECAIHRITSSACDPQIIKSRSDLEAVMTLYRSTLNEIRLSYGPEIKILFLLLSPASVSIEAGRQLMKGDPLIAVYDRNYITKEWKEALVLNGKEANECTLSNN